MTDTSEARAPQKMPELSTDLIEEGMRFLAGALDSPPTDEQRIVHRAIVEDFATIYAEIKQFTAVGRHRSLAITHLEAAKMYAIAALYDGPYTKED